MERFGMTPKQVEELPVDLVKTLSYIDEAKEKKRKWEKNKGG